MSAVRKCHSVGVLAAATALVIGLSTPPRPVAAALVVELETTSNESIPELTPSSRPFKSWSLFLICNPAWVLPQNEVQLTELYLAFKAFGNAIGVEHAAVWFRVSTGIDKESLVDVLRSAAFCTSLKLAPSAGPYVVITTEYPGAGRLDQYPQSFPKELKSFSVISLAEKDSDQIIQSINKLADILVLQKMKRLDPQKEEWWRGLERGYEGFRKSFVGTAKGMTFKIKTPFFELETKL